MTSPANDHFHIALAPGQSGEDRIALQLDNGQMVQLSANEARALATSLIHAVNRVEVKTSLRVSHNLWRRNDHAEPQLSLAR